MSEPKENEVKNDSKIDAKLAIPDKLPEGFPPVEPHINHESNKFTINLVNGNVYTVTSNAKKPSDVLNRIFSEKDAPNAISRRVVAELKPSDETHPQPWIHETTFYLFPEASVQISPSTLEGIEAGWPPEDMDLLEPEDDEDEEDEDERPRKKPKKPW
jgi:hypothetical protein